MYNINFPPSLQWEVTPLCNHNCIHCYNYWRDDQHIIDNVDDSFYMKIATKIVELKPIKVTLTGGEPLLIFNKIKECIDLFLLNGISVSINTNATLITDEIALYLKENHISLYISFPCSIPNVCDEITC